ncbi:MAG: 1-acyl-sn-glycerol-3-phosphate acyltransferase [Bacteroidota bacterium]
MSLLYQFVKWSGRIAMPLYFGKIEVNGRENIPTDQPYIFAPNHQAAFLDALIVGIQNGPEVSFLTRSDVFVDPFKPILRALNMMPVYRIRDGYDKLKLNDEVFARCQRLLSMGKPVLIFPEGNMGEGHHLRPLTKGTARMAFTAQSDLAKDLFIIPVGINYFHHWHPLHKLTLNYGAPIRVRDFADLYDANKAKGLITLRDTMHTAIAKLLIIPERTPSYEDQVHVFGRRYEALPFSEVRKVASYPQSLKPEPYYKWLTPMVWLFEVPNLPVIYIIRSVIRRMQDDLFAGSLKYVLSLVLFPIWWLIVLVVTSVSYGIDLGICLTSLAAASLFLSQMIKKWVR